MDDKKPQKRDFFLGTWQLSGQFGAISTDEASDFIKECQALGVRHFDTAIAYGKGAVEGILGSSLENDAFVVTKIPSIDKRYPLARAYPREHVLRSIHESCSRLKRVPDVFLFHYWSREWPVGETLELINKTVSSASVKAIGISIPNGYQQELNPDILDAIQYVEIPCNKEELWVTTDYVSNIKKKGIDVLLRSLFKQGLLTRDSEALKQIPPSDDRYAAKDEYLLGQPISPEEVITRTLRDYQCSLVVGASNIRQVKTNIHTFNKYEVNLS